jgi:hypothetical protein
MRSPNHSHPKRDRPITTQKRDRLIGFLLSFHQINFLDPAYRLQPVQFQADYL